MARRIENGDVGIAALTPDRAPASLAPTHGAADDMRSADLLWRLGNVPFSRWHTKARIVMGSATFFDAFDALALAFILPVLIGLWHLNSTQIGALIASGYLGQVIGALFFGWFAEKYGRVRSASTTTALMSVMGLVCAFTGSFNTLFICRFIQGIGVGGEVPVAAAYINELSNARGRGRFFMLYELIFPIGLLAAAQIGAFVVPRFGWETMFFIGGVPGLLIVWAISRLPESPRWLIARGRYDEAERIIERIEASTPLRNAPADTAANSAMHAEIVESLAAQRRADSLRKNRWTELFSPFYRRRTLIVWVLWATSYFVANGLNNWLPSLYKTVYHMGLQESLRTASLSNVLSTCMAVVCALCIDKVGRRNWATGTFVIAGCLLGALWLHGAQTAGALMLLGSSAYGFIGTTTVLLYLYTPEVYPTRMRAVGTALATSWLRLASAAGPAVVGVVLGSHGIGAVFLMFAVVCAIGAIAATRMIETRERSLEELAP